MAPAGSTVRTLMPPGRSEHGYEPTPRDLADLAKADVVVYVGLGLEPRVESFVKDRPRPSRIDLCMAAALKITAAHDHDEHDHDDHADHEHAVDPHLWLDPVLVEQFIPHAAAAVRQASARKQALSEPASAALADKERALVTRVRAMDDAWRTRLAPYAGRAIVTHHNAFPRPAARYGLRVAAVIRGLDNVEPPPSAMEKVVTAVRREQVHAVFVEPQFNASLAERIAKAAGVRVARLDPLGAGDWFAMMAGNLDSLTANLGPSASPSSPSDPK